MSGYNGIKFGEYVKGLVELLENNPKLSEAIIVYASDDEGNSFHPLGWHATMGYFDKDELYFYSESDLIDEKMGDAINAVCVN